MAVKSKFHAANDQGVYNDYHFETELAQIIDIVRRPYTSQAVGDIKFASGLPTGWYLECTTAGDTSNTDLTLPATPAIGDTVTDGTVTWTIRKIGSSSGGGGGGGEGGEGDGVPLGTIIPYSGGNTLPAGYLVCNGAAVSRTMYQDLFTLIGTKYGAGDGTTTFNLPSYQFAASVTANVYGNGKSLAFTDGSILFGPRTSSSSGVSYATTAYGKDVGSALSSGSGLTSGKVTGIATKELLGNTPENSGLTAELSTDSNTIYLIKAFNGQTELIDVTQYAQALADLSILVPPGTLIPSASDNAQDGYLLCDGSAVSRTTYVALFDAIGTKYGTGDGSTTFNLPLLTDSRYLQGGTTAGTQVSAGLPDITGNITSVSSTARVCAFGPNTTTSGAFSKYSLGSTGDNINNTGGNYAQYGLQIKASSSNSIYGSSTTVTPKSLTTRWMIKY